MKGLLILENGSVFEGDMVGQAEGMGELVFNTGMQGYQECFTDPSYEGQILTLTYPLIGNYGVNEAFMQNSHPAVSGFIVDQLAGHPSNWECQGTMEDLILKFNVPCLCHIDTRAVTRMIRTQGVMKALIVKKGTSGEIIRKRMAEPLHRNNVERVSVEPLYMMGTGKYVVSVLNCGVKKSILQSLADAGCTLHVFPARSRAEELLSVKPDGIFLSPGPGDPQDIPGVIQTVKDLIGKKPIFGICLGNQLLGLALGAHTFKMRFGHRGTNHPVRNLKTGRVFITSQNHGYAISDEGLPDCMEITYRSVNDGTIEGFRHKTLPVEAVQFHPEAHPGPKDTFFLFDKFVKTMEDNRK